MRKDGARIASARSSASEAMRPTFTPGPGATSYWVTTGPTVRPAIAPSTRKVWSVSINFCPIWSICTSCASPSSGGAGFRSSSGGMSTPSGTGVGRDGGTGLTLRVFPDTTPSEAGTGAGGFATSSPAASPFFPLRAGGRAITASPAPLAARSSTNGCHPTEKIPNAESRNRPTNAPPAVPTAWCTPWASTAGTRPTSFWVALQAR